jgi:hypothetical protein
MKRSGFVRRMVGLLTGTLLVLSLTAPARAQFDPVTLSLIMGGFQLIMGVATAVGLGVSQDMKQQAIGTPWGMPCGEVDGVPQICWQPNAGGFEGSPDLPTGSKPFSTPQPPRPSPSVELQLEIQPLQPANRETVQSQ